MFLKREISLFNISNDRYENNITKNGKNLPFINPEKIDVIIEDVGYWRKFNALHKWFVDNVQDGIDECQTGHVTIEHLKDLHKLLKDVQNNPENASKLLPTTEGFFFGGTDYDEYYFEYVSETIEILERLIKEHEKYHDTHEEYFTYSYRSSW